MNESDIKLIQSNLGFYGYRPLWCVSFNSVLCKNGTREYCVFLLFTELSKYMAKELNHFKVSFHFLNRLSLYCILKNIGAPNCILSWTKNFSIFKK